jgi:hypothetical protein
MTKDYPVTYDRRRDKMEMQHDKGLQLVSSRYFRNISMQLFNYHLKVSCEDLLSSLII